MISILTPTNNTQYLQQVYETLKEQTFTDWEWILIPNGGIRQVQDFNDPRVKVYPFVIDVGRVGALKYIASTYAQGDILLELDHDDYLTPDCLEEVVKGLQEADMVYSNFASVTPEWENRIWSEYYGWQYRDFEYKGHKIKEVISPSPIPSNLSRIWFAPNHVRAWKKDFYFQIGGHDQSMKISDDHDLICRTYLNGRIKHIDKCLYIYRVHGNNTWLQNMDEIQTTMWQNYDKYIYPMVEKSAQVKIDLGGGIDKPQGYTSYDLRNADIVGDLNETWKLDDNSVDLLRAHDILEHLKDPIHAMNEAYRVLKHGGYFMILVPSSDGVGAFCDPTHVSYWNKRSFRYYTEKNMRRYIEPMCQCKFQVMKLENVTKWDNVPYIEAHLICCKDGRFHGAWDW